jgi:DNA-binding YbaB/EbfC family protein
MVTVTLNGKSDLKSVRVDDSLLKASEKEILEDLLVAAHADARRKVESLTKDKMQSVAGGLPLPPGMKLF